VRGFGINGSKDKDTLVGRVGRSTKENAGKKRRVTERNMDRRRGAGWVEEGRRG
jgi:hypothetical protein